jgi:hypothetical protein
LSFPLCYDFEGNALSVNVFIKNLRKKGLKTLPEEPNKYNMIRPMCSVCNRNPCAANYYRNGIRHYRSKCEDCIRKKKKAKIKEPRWKKLGYSKKTACDLCGFKKTFDSQMLVFHVDGNLNNNELLNLRTVCLNCVEVLKHREVTWKRGDLEVD